MEDPLITPLKARVKGSLLVDALSVVLSKIEK